MLRVRCMAILSLAMLGLGYVLGSTHTVAYKSSSKSPIFVDYCFLVRNPEMIGPRRFLTSAVITPAHPHPAGLGSPSCPESTSNYSELLESNDFVEELNQKFAKNKYDPVPICFEGTLYRPSLIRRWWFSSSIRRFALTAMGHNKVFGDPTPAVTIRRYRGIGDPMKYPGDASRAICPSICKSGQALDIEVGRRPTI